MLINCLHILARPNRAAHVAAPEEQRDRGYLLLHLMLSPAGGAASQLTRIVLKGNGNVCLQSCPSWSYPQHTEMSFKDLQREFWHSQSILVWSVIPGTLLHSFYLYFFPKTGAFFERHSHSGVKNLQQGNPKFLCNSTSVKLNLFLIFKSTQPSVLWSRARFSCEEKSKVPLDVTGSCSFGWVQCPAHLPSLQHEGLCNSFIILPC